MVEQSYSTLEWVTAFVVGCAPAGVMYYGMKLAGRPPLYIGVMFMLLQAVAALPLLVMSFGGLQ